VSSKQRELFSLGKPPTEKLRVLGAVPNKIGRARKLRIDFHMEVPKESVVHRAFHSSSGVNLRAREGLDNWKHSDGTTLLATVVDIEARRVGDTVIALVVERIPGERKLGSDLGRKRESDLNSERFREQAI
jgi:hypothetical protein